MITTVTLSDGHPCKVRQLGIFELDSVAPSSKLGPFLYDVQMIDGSIVKDVYHITQLQTPPPEPTSPRDSVKPKSEEYYAWLEWETYHAAKAYYEEQQNVIETYNRDVLRHILDYALMNRSDVSRIVTEEDWEKVYQAALVPEVDEILINEVLTKSFKAQYAGRPVLEALQDVEGGAGGYLAVKKWESELMLTLRLSEEEYSAIPVMERARKIVAMKLDDWMGILENDRISKEMEAKKKRAR